MARNTSIILDDHYESFVDKQIEVGAYQNTSEVIRDALRRLEIEKQKEAWFDAALRAGVASPRAKPGTFDRVRAKHGIKK